MNLSDNQKLMLRWCSWFFLGNILLFFLIGLNYLPAIPVDATYDTFEGKLSLFSFASLAYLGEVTVFALMLAIVPILFSLIGPVRRLVFLSAFLMTTGAVIFLSIDTVIYKLFRFHINGAMTEFIFQGIAQDVLGLSKFEMAGLILGPCFIYCLEWIYGAWIWRNIKLKRSHSKLYLWCSVILLVSVIFSHALFFVDIKHPLFSRVYAHVTRVLPFYTRIEGMMFRGKNNQFDMGHAIADNLVRHDGSQNGLKYPVSLSCSPHTKPLNLIIIVIDTWRFDMLKPDVMPFLSGFSKRVVQFQNHLSGGDATGPGIFSLFYGIPPTYWASVSHQHHGPIFIDELLRQHYQMGIFSSATLKLPDLSNTVFSSIKNLRIDTQGETPDQRDVAITQNFKQFIENVKQKQQSFFGFLFYDSAHAYCEVKNATKPFKPATEECNRFILTNHSDPVPYVNRYKNALLTVDRQIKEVITTLKNDGLLDNTVILITGDHGEEFNDNHLGYWGHSSNFLRYQVQTPLLVYWPGIKPAIYDHRTSHYDIVPTIMSRMLNCKTPAVEYSVGTNLWDTGYRQYLIVGSYVDFGIIEHDRVTTIYPSGNYDVSQLDGKLLISAAPNASVMGKVSLDLKRFYK